MSYSPVEARAKNMTPSRSTTYAMKRTRLSERTMLACTGCKQRKLKCDGRSPKCQNCSKNNRDCLVEDPATGLHRPRDYIQSLEARVAYLEGLLQQTRPDVAQDHLPPGDDVELSSTVIRVPKQTGAQSLERSPPRTSSLSHVDSLDSQIFNDGQATSPIVAEEPADMLSSEVALLCLSAAGREPHYFGPSSAVSFSRLVGVAMGLKGANGGFQQSTIGETDVAYEETYPDISSHFPPPVVARSLSQAYFDNIHSQYPFLHQPTFRLWEDECISASLEGQLGVITGVPLFFVLMVYAIGSLAVGNGQHETAEIYYSMALDRLGHVLEHDSLESIQSILCCAVYSIRSPVGISLWKVSGMAIRHCVELGYHRSAARFRRTADHLTMEMTKRCFWVAYDIDRVVAFILGRPVGIPDDSIDVELPLDMDDEDITRNGLLRSPRTSAMEPPTQMTGAIHVIKLRQLWSKFSDNLYPSVSSQHDNRRMRPASVETLRKELEDWRIAIPEAPNASHPRPLSVYASPQWFRLAYDHSILLLYRHHITGNSSESEDPDMAHAFLECSNHARELCLLYRRLYHSSSVKFTWGSLHILFLGGVTYLYCLWRSKHVRNTVRRGDVINTCMACSMVLVIIAERWKLATSYRDIFEALSERTISMICADDSYKSEPFQFSNSSHTTSATANATSSMENAPILPDWIMDIDDISIPIESDWLVQELLQDVRDFQPDLMSHDPNFDPADDILLAQLTTDYGEGSDMPNGQF